MDKQKSIHYSKYDKKNLTISIFNVYLIIHNISAHLADHQFMILLYLPCESRY